MTIISIIQIVFSVLLILVVLLQQGKGADLGASFGGGGNSLFGASGADNLLVKLTIGFAVIFMGSTIYITSKSSIYNRDPATFSSELFNESAGQNPAKDSATQPEGSK